MDIARDLRRATNVPARPGEDDITFLREGRAGITGGLFTRDAISRHVVAAARNFVRAMRARSAARAERRRSFRVSINKIPSLSERRNGLGPAAAAARLYSIAATPRARRVHPFCSLFPHLPGHVRSISRKFGVSRATRGNFQRNRSTPTQTSTARPLARLLANSKEKYSVD